MRYDDPQLQEALASAYVAGALHGRARRRFEALMRARPGLRRRVEAWEDRLTPLSDATPAVQPPARVWRAIHQRIAPNSAAAPERRSFWDSLAFWRPFGAVAAVLALVLATYAGVETFAPWEEEQVAETTPQQVAPSYVAVLEDESNQPVMVVTAFKGPWRVVVEPLQELSPYAGKAFQVWAVERDSGTIRPLLQVSSGEVLRLPLDEDGWAAIKTSESLTVTLEDAGAAPAAPSGPVLYSGLCLNLKGPTEI
ncbi:anti-sigma factor [Pelagibius marinus]|uniref:anti-sigma factor n=1 Tax=Pelagibius marinus TaxID=2762760 RepID=UPI0018725CF0|nr:anti-sigma factor [Pelagibius marinus]